MMRIKSNLKVAAAVISSVIVAACASTPMLIAPSEELFRAALLHLTDREQGIVKSGFSFRLDFSDAQFFDPVAEGSRRTTADLYKIDHLKYAEYFNEELAAGASMVAKIEQVRVFTRTASDTGLDTPIFAVEWVNRVSEHQMTVRGRGEGESYYFFQVGNVTTNPISVRSANIACFAAFLKAAVALEEQLEPKSDSDAAN